MLSGPESMQKGDMSTTSNWRLLVLLNFVASQDVNVESNHRLLHHILEDFEDLMYTDSFVSNHLARISSRVLMNNLSDSPAFIKKERTVLL